MVPRAGRSARGGKNVSAQTGRIPLAPDRRQTLVWGQTIDGDRRRRACSRLVPAAGTMSIHRSQTIGRSFCARAPIAPRRSGDPHVPTLHRRPTIGRPSSAHAPSPPDDRAALMCPRSIAARRSGGPHVPALPCPQTTRRPHVPALAIVTPPDSRGGCSRDGARPLAGPSRRGHSPPRHVRWAVDEVRPANVR